MTLEKMMDYIQNNQEWLANLSPDDRAWVDSQTRGQDGDAGGKGGRSLADVYFEWKERQGK